MRLIINADDFGMSDAVNEAIHSAIEKGLVTSASILANAPAASGALRIAIDFPQTSFGVHLNLTQFEPLSGPSGLTPFLDDQGGFQHRPLRSALSTSVASAIVREWLAQVERVRAGGVHPSHVDSHHHVHAHPYMFLSLKRVQQCAGISRVRISKNINGPRFPEDYSHRSLSNSGLGLLQTVSNVALRTVPPAKTSNGILSLMEFYQMHRAGAFSQPPWTTSRRNWTIEIMVHPGHASYREENELLESGWLNEFDYERISYAEL